MSAPGSTNALRNETFDNLQLNAGIFIKNFDYSSATSAEELKALILAEIQSGANILGATRGGGTFTVTREMRTPDIDGLRYRFKGGNFVDSVDAYLTTTVVEVTPGNFASLLGADKTTNGKKTTIQMQTAIGFEDYLTNVCWVGDISDGRYVLVCLKNAINTADFTLSFSDKSEGTLAVEFHACQEEVNDYDEAPFEVIFFETEGELGEITVTSAAGTTIGFTALSTTYSLTSGQHFVYKIGTTTAAPAIGYHEEPDYTWNEWNGDSEIAVGITANGKKATLAVINGSNKAIKSGTVTLVVKTA